MARANMYWQEQSPWPIHKVMSWSPEQDSLFSLVTSHLKRTQPRCRHNTIVWLQSQIYLSIYLSISVFPHLSPCQPIYFNRYFATLPLVWVVCETYFNLWHEQTFIGRNSPRDQFTKLWADPQNKTRFSLWSRPTWRERSHDIDTTL